MQIRSEHSFYSNAAHDDLLEQWQRVRAEEGPLELDLTRVSFIDPFGIVALVLFINHLPDEARPVRLRMSGFDWRRGEEEVSSVLSSSTDVASYLTRMDFWDAVFERIDAPPAKIPLRLESNHDQSVLLSLTNFQSHDTITRILEQTGEILKSLGYAVTARGHVLEVLSELCSNVLLHANTIFGGVTAMQVYRNRSGARYVVLGIGDAGIGVRRSLAHNAALSPRLETDAQALSVAVQAGTSRFSVGGHGGGLTRVLNIAERYRGLVAIRSDRGALAYSGARDERRCFEAADSKGVQLRISLPEANLRP